MRKYIRSAVLTVSAALLLSGCGGYNSPSGTEREKDITSAAEAAGEEAATITETISSDKDGYIYADLLLNDYSKTALSVSFSSGVLKLIDNSTNRDISSAPFSTGLTGLECMSCSTLYEIEVKVQTNKDQNALICVFLPLWENDNAKYLVSLYWYNGEKMIKMFHSGDFEPSVNNTDDIILDGNTMIIAVSDRLPEKYEIGSTGMVNKIE